LFTTNVQSSIFASRTAQGYEEWLHSSEAEKQDVVHRWKLIRDHVKKRSKSDATMGYVLEAQRKGEMADYEVDRLRSRVATSAEPINGPRFAERSSIEASQDSGTGLELSLKGEEEGDEESDNDQGLEDADQLF
jgi:hypothetical protein